MGHYGSAPSTQGVPPYRHSCWLDGTGLFLLLLASKLPLSVIVTAFKCLHPKHGPFCDSAAGCLASCASSLCPKSVSLLHMLQCCKKVSQLSKLYKVLHGSHNMQQIRTHVEPACGAASRGVCGIKSRCTAHLVLAPVCTVSMCKLACNQACARSHVCLHAVV